MTLLRQPLGVISVKLHDGDVRGHGRLGGRQLSVVLQQAQAQRKRLPLAVQDVTEHGRQVLKNSPYGK